MKSTFNLVIDLCEFVSVSFARTPESPDYDYCHNYYSSCTEEATLLTAMYGGLSSSLLFNGNADDDNRNILQSVSQAESYR